MRLNTIIAILLASSAAGFAQEHMADTLRNGIVQEDSRQDPRAAIQQYQSVMTQFAEARQTAATALFRMAECFRKQGDRRAAIASYQRVVKDFTDQTKLAAQSRAVLATTYKEAVAASPAPAEQSDKAKFDKLMQQQQEQQVQQAEREEAAGIPQARARYRATIESEIEVLKTQVSVVEQRLKSGGSSIDVLTDYKIKLLQRERDLAAYDAGMATPR